MRVLVAGGAGYIGSHVVADLKEHGFGVVVLDNLSTGHQAAVGRVPIHGVRSNDYPMVKALFRNYKFDAVIDLASYSQVGESTADPMRYYQNNVEGARTLMDAALSSGVDTYIYSSSAAVYGNQMSAREVDRPDPINPYGRTKRQVEEMLEDYHAAYGLKYIALRYFNAAGAWPEKNLGEDHQPETHLIPKIVDAMLLRSDGVKVFGTDYKTLDGTCIRDYVHVQDIAAAHRMALQYLQDGGKSGPINLGSGKGYSVLEVIKAAKFVVDRDFPVEYVDRRPGDPDVLVADIQKAKETIGWKPERNLSHMIWDAYQWHRDHPDGYGDKKQPGRW